MSEEMNVLAYWRSKRKMTLRALGSAADLSPSTISVLEHGKANANEVTIGKLAEVLEVDITVLAPLLTQVKGGSDEK